MSEVKISEKYILTHFHEVQHNFQEKEEVKQQQEDSKKSTEDETLDDAQVKDQEIKTIISKKKVSTILSLEQAILLRNVEKSVEEAVEAKKSSTPEKIFSLHDAWIKFIHFSLNDKMHQDVKVPHSQVVEIEIVQQEESNEEQNSSTAVE